MSDLPMWPHQTFAVEAVENAERQIVVLTSPTGGGKSRIAQRLIENCLERRESAVLYTNRRMLTEQIVRVLTEQGVEHGVRASGYQLESSPVQVSSIPTEHSRVMKRKLMDLHPADLVLVDEGHLQKGPMAQEIYRRHLEAGATVVLITATPIDMGNLCGIEPQLIVAGTNSELRQCGALVPAVHFGPDEPERRRIRKQPWEYTENDVRKLIMVQGIFGRVLAEWTRLNPEQKPTLLFAPGVKESIWFAQQFREAGIRAAHIDGQECWLDGEFYPSNRMMRQEILEGSKDGTIKVICNRFVMREGLDLPWLEVAILATVFGSLQSYLQSGGRLLRAHPGKTCCSIIDHGGNWHAHGSLNSDRTWHLEYTEAMYQGMREAQLRGKKCAVCKAPCKGPICPSCGAKNEVEPFVCPKCKQILVTPTCPCGFQVKQRMRPVVQSDGSVKEYEGEIYKPHRVKQQDDTAKLWEKCYYRAKNSKNEMTFRQAMAMFVHDHGYYPPQGLPLMPSNDMDWYRKVCKVSYDKLIPKEGKQ